jgi:hypothetical protein
LSEALVKQGGGAQPTPISFYALASSPKPKYSPRIRRTRPDNRLLRRDGEMKPTAIALALLLCVISAPACFPNNNANIGTWKLNEAKSKLARGMPKEQSLVYAAVDDSVKVTIDGVDSADRPTHTEWTGKFDGKDYPVTGDPNSDARSYTKIDERTLGFNSRKSDYDTASGRIVVSPDGTRCIVTTSGKNSKGKKFSSVAVYDKQ